MGDVDNDEIDIDDEDKDIARSVWIIRLMINPEWLLLVLFNLLVVPMNQ
jgi:hypothetical protein